ncbi:MAG: aminotransferase class I/II-fold pyridoxal phosphate-dependent enzyme [Hyphomicrobiales bacterium]|nr:aminotransferase class I/II-fold pyridoxal phosphate-dependent enzyme [Hyphomicrobiales bacterium]
MNRPTGQRLKPSRRSEVASFIAMDVLGEANRLEAEGRRILHLEVGQPGTPAPRMVRERARRALDVERLGYTDALGIPLLRARISRHYAETYGLDVPSERIAVTTGSSGGFILSFLAGFDVGARVAMPTPGYPAYRNILTTLGLETVPLRVGEATRWAPTPAMIHAQQKKGPIDGLLVASPANPTGTMLTTAVLEEVVELCAGEGIWFISDEIYHGLTYDRPAETALRFSDDVIVINSFSKYYSMTGWRVGWMVLPERLVRPVERLAQNLFISVPALSQLAAVAAFEATEELEANRAAYAKNRDFLLRALPEVGLGDFLPMDGAFYAYVDVSRHTNDSMDFAKRLLRETGVAVTPGLDFDPENGNRYVRLSFAGPPEDIEEAVRRIGEWLQRFGLRA